MHRFDQAKHVFIPSKESDLQNYHLKNTQGNTILSKKQSVTHRHTGELRIGKNWFAPVRTLPK